MSTQQPANPVPEVFRGRLEECFEHFKRCLYAYFPKGVKGIEPARAPVADFCQVNVWTINDWLRGATFPVGEQKIRLMCFFEMHGYRVMELEEMGDLRPLAEIIGYGLVPIQKIAQELGYKHGPQEVYRALLHGRKVEQTRERLFWAFLKKNKAALKLKKDDVAQKYQLAFPLTDAVRQRKVSAVIGLIAVLENLLESNEIGSAFMQSLKDLPPTDRLSVLNLADKLHGVAVSLAKQGEE